MTVNRKKLGANTANSLVEFSFRIQVSNYLLFCIYKKNGVTYNCHKTINLNNYLQKQSNENYCLQGW